MRDHGPFSLLVVFVQVSLFHHSNDKGQLFQPDDCCHVDCQPTAISADGEGFEPSWLLHLLVFKTSSIGRSDNHPCSLVGISLQQGTLRCQLDLGTICNLLVRHIGTQDTNTI